MVYARRSFVYRKRRPTYRRKRYYKRNLFGKRHYKGKYVTARSQHPEYKFIDKVQAVDVAVADTGSLFTMCDDIVKGTGASQRIGEQVVLRSFQYKIMASADVDAVSTSPLRCIVGIDTQTNGSNPTLSLLLQDTTAPITSPLKMGIAERFKILKDKTYQPDADDPAVWIKGYIRLNHVVKYISANAIPQKNQLFVMLISNRTAATDPPVENHYFRARFTDE